MRKSYTWILILLLILAVVVSAALIWYSCEPPQPSGSQDIPGGSDTSTVSKSSGKVQQSVSLASLSTPSSPPFSVSINYMSNVYLDTLSSTKTVPPSDVGLGWNIPATNSQVVRVTNDTGTFEDDTFFLYMGNSQYTLEYQCDYPCTDLHPDDYEDNTNKTIKYYVTNYPDFFVIKHIVDDGDTGQTYSTWKLTDSSGMTYLFGGHNYTEESTLRTSEKDISGRTICNWLTNTSSETVDQVTVPGELQSGCEPGSVNLGVRWGNWIGANDYSTYQDPVQSSTEIYTQEQFSTSWNLSAITNTLGQETNFYWAQNTQNVGLNGATDQDTITEGIQSFTRDSYLYRVEAENGDRLVFNYCPRAPSKGTVEGSYTTTQMESDRPQSYYTCEDAENLPVEAYDTHQENVEPDGFQEHVRIMYLKSIDTVLNAPANTADSTTYDYDPNNRVELEYNQVSMPDSGTGLRVLTNIRSYIKKSSSENSSPQNNNNGTGDSSLVLSRNQPDRIFCYYGLADADNGCDFGSSDSGMNGFLASSTSVSGGTITYEYEKLDLSDIPVSVQGESGLSKKTPVYGNGFVIVQGERDGFFDVDLYDMTPTGWVVHKSMFSQYEIPAGDDSYFVDQNIVMTPNGFVVVTPEGGLYMPHRTLGTTSEWSIREFSTISVRSIGAGQDFFGVLGDDAKIVIYNTYDNWNTVEPLTLNGSTVNQLPNSDNPDTLTFVSAGANYLGFWRAGTDNEKHEVTLDVFFKKENGEWVSENQIYRSDEANCVNSYLGQDSGKSCEIISTKTSNDIPESPYISSVLNSSSVAVNIPVQQRYIRILKDTKCDSTNGCSFKDAEWHELVINYSYYLNIPIDMAIGSSTLQRVEPFVSTITRNGESSDIDDLPVYKQTGCNTTSIPCVGNDIKDTGSRINPVYLNGYQTSASIYNYGYFHGGYRPSHIVYEEVGTCHGGCDVNGTKEYHTTSENDPCYDFVYCSYSLSPKSQTVLADWENNDCDDNNAEVASSICQGSFSTLSDTMISVNANGAFDFYTLDPRSKSLTASYLNDNSVGSEPKYSTSYNKDRMIASTVLQDAFQTAMIEMSFLDPIGVAFLAGTAGVSAGLQELAPAYHQKVHWSQPHISSMASGQGWFLMGDWVWAVTDQGNLKSVYSIYETGSDVDSAYFGALYGYIPYVIEDSSNRSIYVQMLMNFDDEVNQETWDSQRVLVMEMGLNDAKQYTTGQYQPVPVQNSNPLRYEPGRGAWDRYVNLSGPGAFLVYEYKESDTTSFYSQPDSGEFMIYRVWEEFDTDTDGNVAYSDYIVKQVTTSDGVSASDNVVSYEYDTSQAGYLSSTASGIYGSVTVYPGRNADGTDDPYGKTVYSNFYGSESDQDPLLYGSNYQADVYKSGDVTPISASLTEYAIANYTYTVKPDIETGTMYEVPIRAVQVEKSISVQDQIPVETDYTYTQYNQPKTTTTALFNYKPLDKENPDVDIWITQVDYAWENEDLESWVGGTNSLQTVYMSQTKQLGTGRETDQIINPGPYKNNINALFKTLEAIRIDYRGNGYNVQHPDVWQVSIHGCLENKKGATHNLPKYMEHCQYKINRVWLIDEVNESTDVKVSTRASGDGQTLGYQLYSASSIYMLRAGDDEDTCLTSSAPVLTVAPCDEKDETQWFQFVYGRLSRVNSDLPKAYDTMSLSKYNGDPAATENECLTIGNALSGPAYTWAECGVSYGDFPQAVPQFLVPVSLTLYDDTPVSDEIVLSQSENVYQWCIVPDQNGGKNTCQDSAPSTQELDKWVMLTKEQTRTKFNYDKSSDEITSSTVTVRDPELLVPLEVKDVLGVTSSVVISDNDRLLPITGFTNASISGNEAGYMGFEDYEDTSGVFNGSNMWNVIGGGITDTQSYTGFYSFGADSGNVELQHTVNSQEKLIVSAWLKPQNGGDCGILAIGNQNPVNYTTRDEVWQYLELQASAVNKTSKIVISCEQGGYIDSVRFSPLGSGFTETIYNSRNEVTSEKNYNPYWQVQQVVGDNGATTNLYYDEWFDLYASIYSPLSGTDRMGSFVSGGLSRMSGFSQFSNGITSYETSSFNASLPNSSFAVAIQDSEFDAVYERYADTANNSFDLKKDSFAARFYLSNPVSSTATYVTIKGAQLKYDNTLQQYQLVSDNQPVCQSDEDLHLVQDWIVLVIDDVLTFFGDGRNLMFCSNLDLASGGTIELTSNLGSWENFSLAYDPLVSLSFSDGYGRTVQSHSLGYGKDIGMDNTTPVDDGQGMVDIASGVIYDHWENTAVVSKPAVVGTSQSNDSTKRSEDRFTYFVDFLSFDWDNNALESNSDLRAFYQQSNSADAPYAFLESTYEKSPLGRLISSTTATGEQFALSSSQKNYSTNLEYQNPNEQSIANELNLTEYEENFHFDTSTQDFDGSVVYNQSVLDQVFNPVYTRTVTDTNNPFLEAYVQFGFQQDWQDNNYDESYMSLTSTLLPNYFDSALSNRNKFVNQSQSKDSLGMWVTSASPDVTGMTHIFTDNKGRIRFAQRLDDSVNTTTLSVMENNFVYWKYDDYDRVIETGTLTNDPSSANQNKDPYTLANDTSFPPTDEACVKTLYQYDTNDGLPIYGVDQSTQEDIRRNWHGKMVYMISTKNLLLQNPAGPVNPDPFAQYQCIDPNGQNYQGFAQVWYFYDDYSDLTGVSEVNYSGGGATGSMLYPPISARNTGFEYDNANNLLSTTYPDQDRASTITNYREANFDLSGQKTVFNIYDTLARLISVCDQTVVDSGGNLSCAGGGNIFVNQNTYTFDDLISSSALGNGVIESYEYDFQRNASVIMSEDNQGQTLYRENLYYGIDNSGNAPSMCGDKEYDRGFIVAKEVNTDV